MSLNLTPKFIGVQTDSAVFLQSVTPGTQTQLSCVFPGGVMLAFQVPVGRVADLWSRTSSSQLGLAASLGAVIKFHHTMNGSMNCIVLPLRPAIPTTRLS